MEAKRQMRLQTNEIQTLPTIDISPIEATRNAPSRHPIKHKALQIKWEQKTFFRRNEKKAVVGIVDAQRTCNGKIHIL